MPTTLKAAFALPKEVVRTAQPFGTVQLNELKHSGGNGATEPCLVPLPSTDPQDPLNWPRWLKIISLLCMSSYAFVTNFASSSIASAFPLLATPLGFNRPLGELGYLIPVNVLMIGVASFWWVPLASIVVAPTVLGEIFFVHERGKAMGLYSVMLALGPLTGGLSGGYLAASMGIPWINWLNTILAGTLFLACCIFQPETLFERPEEAYAPANVDSHIPDKDMGQHVHIELATELSSPTSPPTLTPMPTRPPMAGPFSLRRALSITRPNTRHRSVLSHFAAPWLTLRLPGVWVSMLWHAGLVGAVVAISTVGPSLVAHPPYLWGHNAGLINVGGMVGVLIGLCMTAALADRILDIQARRPSAGGIVEAEGCLLIAVPGLLLVTTGIWTFGFCAAHPSWFGWVGMQVGFGMLGFGLA
ncbi:major facilitator superfamily domain-containing protein [Aspergillus insuetus]